ncbi:MAG: DsbA family protein [Parvibaculum sp.]|nr:DsbA family protein [Parvibaculum sp.]
MHKFLRWVSAGTLAFGLACGASAGQAAEFNKTQTKAIEQIVRDYIVAHPEVLIEAMTSLDAKEAAAKKKVQDSAISKNRDAIFNDPTSFVAGNPKGDVTIVEFFDYNCGYCKRAVQPLLDTVAKDGKVRLVLKELPILGPSSVTASHAALAAHRQGKYMELYKALYAHKGPLDDEAVFNIAADIGLDIKQLSKDMMDPAIAKIIAKNEKLAEALSISGTPSFVIGDRFYPGVQDTDQLVAAIKLERAK